MLEKIQLSADQLLSRKKNSQQQPAGELPQEEKRAETVTIAWMLCVLFTFCAEVVGLLSKVGLSNVELNDPQSRWAVLPVVTLAMGLVTGTISLILTPLVYRWRKIPPPESITLVAVLVGLTPLATLLLQWLRG